MSDQLGLFAAAPSGGSDGPRGTVGRETFSRGGGSRGIDKAGARAAAIRAGEPLCFWRCVDCLCVLATEERVEGLRCGACGGGVEFMGRAGKQPGARLKTTHVEAVCNDQCVAARGPHCECGCGGRNHGTGRWVVVTRDEGAAPTITPPTEAEARKCRARGEEYRAARTAANEALGWALALADRKRGGEYLSGAEFRRFIEGRRLVRALFDAEKGRTHKGRLAKLARLVERAWGLAWHGR